MFQCNQCKTEYGGIRGVTADRCPRCVAKDGVSTQAAFKAFDDRLAHAPTGPLAPVSLTSPHPR